MPSIAVCIGVPSVSQYRNMASRPLSCFIASFLAGRPSGRRSTLVGLKPDLQRLMSGSWKSLFAIGRAVRVHEACDVGACIARLGQAVEHREGMHQIAPQMKLDDDAGGVRLVRGEHAVVTQDLVAAGDEVQRRQTGEI